MRVMLATSFPIPGEYDGTAMLPIKIMRALKGRGIDVVLAYLKARRPWNGPTVTEFEGTPIHTLSPPWWIAGMKRIERAHPFDVVHAQHYGGATRSYAACLRYGWPLVYEIHSLLGDEVDRDRLGRDWKFHTYKMLERQVLREAAAIVVLGEPVRDVLVREKHVPADRVSLIYPGINLAEYEGPIPPAQIPGIQPDHKVLMYVGSIVHPNQGVGLLIEALPRVFATMPEARCVLVGGPAEAGKAYRAQLGEYGEKLIILPGQTPAQVVSLTKRADVLVHPRLACRENYSVQSKLAVYLAAGRPIVATDFGDYRKLLGATGAGWLTPVEPMALASGIVQVLLNRTLATRLAAATGPVAREYFGMERNIDRYLDVYKQALARGRVRTQPHRPRLSA